MQVDITTDIKQVEDKIKHLNIYIDVAVKEEQIKKLEEVMNQPGFWLDQDSSKKVLKELKRLKTSVEPLKIARKKIADIKEIFSISAGDQELLVGIAQELGKLSKSIDELEFQTLLNGEFDSNSAILSINAGAGGTESCDWVGMLLRMYTRWAEDHKYKVKTLDVLAGEEAGVKNVTISIDGDFAYGYLKSETGVHRLVRISPFDANKRRHTSFASVDAIAQVEDDIDIQIRPEELKMDTYRSSGAGGQHVNVTDSAVRLTHIPTGIITQCQNERSQFQNKEVALKVMKAKLYELKRKEQEEKISKEYGAKQKIEWGSQIRSYVMQPYQLIKDHRTDFETGDVDSVMDGHLDEFIHAYLKMKRMEKKQNA